MLRLIKEDMQLTVNYTLEASKIEIETTFEKSGFLNSVTKLLGSEAS